MGNTKIFGIGLQRTGTTSLYAALKMLGIQAAPHGIPLFYNLDDPILNQFDAFMDNPIPLIYQELDRKIHGCKFIVTDREEEDWLRSVEWLFNDEMPRMDPKLRTIGDEIHERFYGTRNFDRELFRARKRSYYQEVDHYFSNRSQDVLKIDFTTGANWHSICQFLSLPIPKKDFPWLNASTKKGF